MVSTYGLKITAQAICHYPGAGRLQLPESFLAHRFRRRVVEFRFGMPQECRRHREIDIFRKNAGLR